MCRQDASCLKTPSGNKCTGRIFRVIEFMLMQSRRKINIHSYLKTSVSYRPTSCVFCWFISSRNVQVEWLALPHIIREVPCSNLGPKISYPDRFVRFSSTVPHGICRDSTLNYATATSTSFTIRHSRIILIFNAI